MAVKTSFSISGFKEIIWSHKWIFILITGVFTCVGITYALLAREEYRTFGKILPELQGKGAVNLSQFAGLAGLAGIDLSSMGGGGGIDAVRPDLYPDVITSTPFYLQLFSSKVRTMDNSELKFEDYYHSVIEEGKEFKEEDLKKFPVKSEGIIVINKLSNSRLKDLKGRITANIDKKSGVITIDVKMPDPVVAAETARFAMDYLMSYVKAYRTEKLRQDVNYLAEQVSTSRGKYYTSQQKKASYSDQFQDMMLQSADIQRERIEAEYKLSSTFYNELLKKYEEAKFRLHQETPVFKVLEPPVVPVKKSEPRRSLITLFSLVLGSIFATLYILMKGDNYSRVIVENKYDI